MESLLPKFKAWFDRGVEMGATHMVVAYRSSNQRISPSYVMPNDNLWHVQRITDGRRILEVYNLSADFPARDDSPLQIPTKTSDRRPIDHYGPPVDPDLEYI